MADFGKIQKKGRFGKVPTPETTAKNLEAPEVAPAAQKKSRGKTGRTVPFSTRVSADFDKNFRRIAFENGLKKCELLEQCLDLYIKFNNIPQKD